ncbi:two-pore potassium channel 3-like [Rhodamnia argentea]|uniref:Two-pore potassium channel 3-like n=1 Tax=Rhodamnia argentea TaxID=178133 RepID=A0A8B8PUY6_9MYRT|nr:two-pore potassium channel 3-like [Rhodamnia argentea]
MDNQPFLLHPGRAEESGMSTNDNLSSGVRDAADDDGIVPAPRTPRSSPSYVDLVANLNNTKKLLIRRSHSAPAMFSGKKELVRDIPGRAPEFTFSIVGLPLIYVLAYFTIGISVYMTTGSFKHQETEEPVRFIDVMYFTAVTLCTTGYGDISPSTTSTKLFTSALILAGLWILGILLNGLIPYICDWLEAVMLRAVHENSFNAMVRTYMVDKEKGRMRIRIKVCLALGVVFICIAVGTVTVHFLEGLSWVDSLYLSVSSVTTVGYGDCGFSTAKGRGFAIVWLLLSTLAVAKAFLYLTELRIDPRNLPNENRVLQQKMTLGDLIAADLYKDGCVRRSEFIIYKLKQMGKIAERDIAPISNRFDVLDTSRFGKITLSGLIRESE